MEGGEMDVERFDGLVRSVGQSRSRRQTLLGLATVGVATLGLRQQAHAQTDDDPFPEDDLRSTPQDLCDRRELDLGICGNQDVYGREPREAGESVFAGATAERLAIGLIPALPPEPVALALQRVSIAPGGRTVTPAGDPRVVLIVVERGTLTVNNTEGTVVTRGGQIQDAVPAGTTFTMSAGDANLSPVGTGGELRNDGSEEVILLAGILVPVGDGSGTTVRGSTDARGGSGGSGGTGGTGGHGGKKRGRKGGRKRGK
jgi:quercetin dioxygenase-like cupin family protein